MMERVRGASAGVPMCALKFKLLLFQLFIINFEISVDYSDETSINNS